MESEKAIIPINIAGKSRTNRIVGFQVTPWPISRTGGRSKAAAHLWFLTQTIDVRTLTRCNPSLAW